MIKKIVFSIGVVLLSIIIYSVIKFDAEYQFWKEASNPNKVVINNLKIIGYEHALKTWEISALKGWSHSSQHIMYIEGLKSGSLYNRDQIPVLSDISANFARANTQNKLFLVTGNIQAKLHHKNTENPIKINTNKLLYTHTQSLLEFSDGLRLVKAPYTLRSKNGSFNTQLNVLSINSPLSAQSTDSTVQSDKAQLSLDTKTIEFISNVILTHQKITPSEDEDTRTRSIQSQKSTMKTEWLIYSEIDSSLCSQNEFSAFQTDKRASGAQFCYDTTKGGIQASKITINLESLSFLIKSDIKKKIQNKVVNTLSEKPIQISADRLEWFEDKKQLVLENHVHFKQKEQFIKADKCTYNDAQNTLLFEGNVHLKRYNKEELTTQILRINLNTQDFETAQSSRLEFYLEK